MPQKKVQPGVAYTKSGEKKISGSASTTPAPKAPTLGTANTNMTSSIKSRSKFEDQKKVDSVYRWK
jgi:hypothetical protein